MLLLHLCTGFLHHLWMEFSVDRDFLIDGLYSDA